VGDLAHEPLERELLDKEVGRLLVLPDLTQDRSGFREATRLLDATDGKLRHPTISGVEKKKKRIHIHRGTLLNWLHSKLL
jgi:hypothetical protein